MHLGLSYTSDFNEMSIIDIKKDPNGSETRGKWKTTV